MLEYIKLMRLNQPTGFFLLFWPSSFGLLLGSKEHAPYSLILLFLIGSIIIRGAGCIVNDIIDKDLDKHVERTKNRPIAKGTISVLNAAIFASILALGGFFILISLPVKAIYVGLFSIILVFIYPFMKRITNYPQAFLSTTFNIGAIIGFFSVNSQPNLSLILLYIACMFWTLGYDTIYGHQDKKYDKKIGIKSTSITFEKHTALALTIFYSAMIMLLFITGILENYSWRFFFIMSIAAIHLLWQILSLDKNSPGDCMSKFKSNIYLGAIIFIAFLSTQKFLTII